MKNSRNYVFAKFCWQIFVNIFKLLIDYFELIKIFLLFIEHFILPKYSFSLFTTTTKKTAAITTTTTSSQRVTGKEGKTRPTKRRAEKRRCHRFFWSNLGTSFFCSDDGNIFLNRFKKCCSTTTTIRKKTCFLKKICFSRTKRKTTFCELDGVQFMLVVVVEKMTHSCRNFTMN